MSAALALARDGFAYLPGLLAPARVAELRSAFVAAAVSGPAASDFGTILHNPWCRIPAVAAEIQRGTLAELAMRLLGESEVVLFQDLAFCKSPGTRSPVQWHQDYSYWPLDSWRGLIMWIALDDADSANGCMRYLPGTHRLGERKPADFISGVTDPADAPELPPLDVDAHLASATWAPARAGDAYVHHPLVWHMSPANATNRPRHAWNLWWLSEQVRWDPSHAPHPFNEQLRPRAGELPADDLFPRFSR